MAGIKSKAQGSRYVIHQVMEMLVHWLNALTYQMPTAGCSL